MSQEVWLSDDVTVSLCAVSPAGLPLYLSSKVSHLPQLHEVRVNSEGFDLKKKYFLTYFCFLPHLYFIVYLSRK